MSIYTRSNMGCSRDNNLSSIVKNVDGIQLTVSDRSSAGNFRTDSDGVCVVGNSTFCSFNGALGVITSLNLTFDAPVQLISYNIGFNNKTSPIARVLL